MRRSLLGIVVAGVVGGVGWLVLGPQMRPSDQPAQSTAQTPLQLQGQPVEGGLRFESVPPGAEVVGPTGVLGITPFAVPIPKNSRPKSVVYRMKGYYTQQKKVPKDGDLVSAEMFLKKPNR